jgi:hypothetical protein
MVLAFLVLLFIKNMKRHQRWVSIHFISKPKNKTKYLARVGVPFSKLFYLELAAVRSPDQWLGM